mgnify:CR=1 FL=1
MDPYTEFETAQEATDLTESIDGKYAGVGLVITGSPATPKSNANGGAKNNDKILPKAAQDEAQKLMQDGDMSSSNAGAAVQQQDASLNLNGEEEEDDEEELDDFQVQQKIELSKARKNGIRVVNAFEGYAFDYGLRVGDKLVAIDDKPIDESTTVDQVRSGLRGEPGTLVSISFEREGVPEVQTITMPRQVVRIDDVKLATLVGNPADGIGYIQLTVSLLHCYDCFENTNFAAHVSFIPLFSILRALLRMLERKFGRLSWPYNAPLKTLRAGNDRCED